MVNNLFALLITFFAAFYLVYLWLDIYVFYLYIVLEIWETVEKELYGTSDKQRR